MAGKRRSFARWTSFSICAAPSRRLYSEWTWRGTNSLCCMDHPRAVEASARQEDGESLPHLALQAGGAHLVLDDRVGVAQDRETLGRDFAEHADREAWSRERLAPDDLRRQPEDLAEPPDLVLEQLPQGFDQLELHLERQAADVVVGLDRRRRPAEGNRLDHVRIEGALGEPGDLAELPGLFFEDGDELGADPLALDLRIGDATQNVEEAVAGIDMDQVDLEGVTEGMVDRPRLALPQEPVVDEDARELIPDGAVDQHRDHRRVHPARQRAQDAAGADFLSDLLDRRVDEAGHGPRAARPADVEEVVEDLPSLRRVDDLRVELDRVELPLVVGHRGDRAVQGGAEGRKALRRPEDGVAVAHPDGHATVRLGLDAPEEAARAPELDFGLAVLPAVGGHDVAAEEIPHRLHAVADAEDGDTRVEERLRRQRRAILVDARRPAREDDPLVAAREDRLRSLGGGGGLGGDRQPP